MNEKYRILGDFGSFSVNVGLNSTILTQKCPYMGIESTIYRTNKTISVIVPIQGTLSGTWWVHDQATSETWKIFLKNPQNLPDSTRNQSEFRRGTFLNRKNTQSYATYQIFKSFGRIFFWKKLKIFLSPENNPSDSTQKPQEFRHGTCLNLTTIKSYTTPQNFRSFG